MLSRQLANHLTHRTINSWTRSPPSPKSSQLDPTNAFARYGLAMEHISQGNTDTALTEFTTLIHHNPDYVPAYQMSAQTLAKLGRTEEAVARLQVASPPPNAPTTPTPQPKCKPSSTNSPSF